MLLTLFVTGLVAGVALADTGTKSVLTAPGLLRAPVLQGSRFVVNDQEKVVDSIEQGQQQPVTSSLEPNVVLHQEVPQESVLPQQVFYGSPQSYSSPSVPSRGYVSVYAPYYSNAVHYVAQPQVLGVNPITAPLQFFIRTPSGPLLFRQVQVAPQQYQQPPPVQYVVGVVPSTRPVQPIQGHHVLVTKAEAPVPFVDASNETQSNTLTLASSSGNTVTDVNAGHSSGEPKTDSVADF